MKISPLIVSSLVLLALSPNSQAEKPEGKGPSPQSPSLAKVSDREFVRTAGTSGIAELNIAKLAGQKATTPKIKEIAATLVKDHTKSNMELSALAQAKQIEIPPPSKKEEKKFEELSQKSGMEFEKAFVKEMRECHKKSISLFEGATKDAGDAEIKAFAAKTLPVLQMHAEHLKQVD